jgi:hypothetical protein
MTNNQHRSYGVFKPIGHVVVSFPSAEQADAAARDLGHAGFSEEAVWRLTDVEMMAQADRDIEGAGVLAGLGQELNLVRAHHALAEQGFHWLIVHAPQEAQSRKVAEVARSHGAERAQLYGTFVIEELIEHAHDEKQVSDTPDRGLDPQTLSGQEAQRADLNQGALSPAMGRF